METLIKEIDKILETKNLEIYLLRSDNERLCKENAKLREDIEKYKENEENRV
jgi:hypothetical protein